MKFQPCTKQPQILRKKQYQKTFFKPFAEREQFTGRKLVQPSENPSHPII